jgi:diacylglycerol kinase (ATP)
MPIKFLINPIAREQGGRRLWNRLHEACTRLGYVVEKDYSLEWTRPEYTVEQAQQAASAWDRVVAVGGDGTVRAVAEGLLKAGTGAALGVIPQGTGNDFARVVGLFQLWARRRTSGVEPIVEHLVTSPTTRVDVLSANDRLFFVSYCGIGWDARVCHSYTQMRRHRALRAALRGRLVNECAYAVLALRYWGTRLPSMCLEYEPPEAGWKRSQILPGASAVIISNVSSYAGGAPLTSDSAYHDGQFEVTPIPRPLLFAALVLSRYWPRLRRFCPLESRRVAGIRLALPSGCALQADGDDVTRLLACDARLSITVAGQISAVYVP